VHANHWLIVLQTQTSLGLNQGAFGHPQNVAFMNFEEILFACDC